MIYYEEYGAENSITIVMLHGTNFVHSFGRQYVLSKNYHIIVPHITGFGKEADKIFNVNDFVFEVTELIKSFEQRVYLIGFSLGAQLSFELVTRFPELFKGAILVSPWLINKNDNIEFILEQNVKQYRSLQKKWLCNLIGIMNGLPKGARKEFVEYMQNVKLQTIINSVDNKIVLDDRFNNVNFPVLSIAGENEDDNIKQSVYMLNKSNPLCQYEIWNKAAHNIPPVFAKQFNEKIISFIENCENTI